jgi:hypothetical protein
MTTTRPLSMIDRKWYQARLIYKMDRCGPMLSIEEDRWLIPAADAGSAFQEAQAGGIAAERIGRTLRTAETNLKDSVDYEFLGFSDLHLVGARLLHGTEVDRYLSTSHIAASELVTSKSAIMAFDPAGPAYEHDQRLKRNAELYKRFEWYLAEQLFGDATVVCGRFALIKASNPDLAYLLGHEDGALASLSLRSNFVGLRQLSLITDTFDRTCILRTDEYSVDDMTCKALVKPKELLAAFGDPERNG